LEAVGVPEALVTPVLAPLAPEPLVGPLPTSSLFPPPLLLPPVPVVTEEPQAGSAAAKQTPRLASKTNLMVRSVAHERPAGSQARSALGKGASVGQSFPAMHVTIVGAGALGRLYGVRLAAAGAQVAFVVRPARLGETTPFVIEQVNQQKRRDEIASPTRVGEVPSHTDAVLVTVRFDQIDGALAAALRNAPTRAPVVALTPMLVAQHAALTSALGRPATAGMPGVSGYLDERDVVRYWIVSVAATLLDDPGADDATTRAALDGLARVLTGAGIPTRLERDVGTHNAATTVAFFPLIAAIDAGGGVDGVLADKPLLSTVFDAAKESDALARRIGKVASWAGMLTTFVGPFTLKPGIGLARRLFPESVRFVEAHFGEKLHGQHVAMGEAILDVAAQGGVEMPALTKLLSRLRSS
jgi:2-dehydropantoate 2-reductase